MTQLKFEELNLSKEIIKAITDMGFEEATPIQSQAIPFLLEGRDIIGQAQTGTGKTAAFGIPIIEKMDSHSKLTQAVVLCPTRELAIQVAEELDTLLKYTKNINVLPIYGGQSMDRQLKALKKGVQIIIATPGRLMDHIDRKTISLTSVKMLILDEADEMLDMGFRDDIEIILKTIPKERQTILFSATMPKAIMDLSKKYLKNPEHVKVVHKEVTVPNVNQFCYEMKQSQKLEILCRLIDIRDPKLSLVFCNTKRAVDELVRHLHARGYSSDALHGGLNQNQRDRVMAKFRTGKLELLVATDVAARGIDVEDIDAVFNYDMPQDEEYYVHRIGRTARAGRSGEAHTFVTGKDFYLIRDIEKYTKTHIVKKPIPTSEDVAEIRESSFVEDVKKAIGDGTDLLKYEHLVDKLIGDDFTPFEVAVALTKMLMKQESALPKAEVVHKKHDSSFKQSNESYDRQPVSSDNRPAYDERKKKFGKEKFGKDKFGKDNTGKDRYGKPLFGKDRFEKDSSGKDRYGKDKFGKDNAGRDKYGKKIFSTDRFEKSKFGGESKFGGDNKKSFKDKKSFKGGGDTVRLFVSAGRMQNVQAKDLVGAFANEAGIPGKSIGAIEIYDKFSFVEVPKEYSALVIDTMNDSSIKGKRIAVDLANDKQG